MNIESRKSRKSGLKIPRNKNFSARIHKITRKTRPFMNKPTAISSSHEDRIRQRAYFLWLESGQLDGQHEQHWLAAAEQLAKEVDPTSAVSAFSPEATAPHLSLRNTVASHQSDPAHRFHQPSKPHDGRVDVLGGEAQQRVRSRSSNLQPPKPAKPTR